MIGDIDILVIEDNEGDAVLLKQTLNGDASGRIEISRTLGYGLELAGRRRFDVLLLDLGLPDSTGAETIERAARALPAMPIVVLTGERDEESAQGAIQSGAQDYLVKGADRDSILRAIRYSIERKAAQVALEQAKGQLEEKVAERTAELAKALEDLREEVRQREQADRLRHQTELEVVRASEREQRRIGRDLHDSIQSSLAGIKMMIDVLRKQVCKEHKEFGPAFDRISKSASIALDQARAMSRSLCPVHLEGMGLVHALEQLADTTTTLNSLRCDFKCRHWNELSEDVAAHLYYICHEAVTNALKHSGADHVWITLDTHGRGLRLEVEDNGMGLPRKLPQGPGMGMRTMAYRAEAIGAKLTLKRAPGGGTLCQVDLMPPAKA